MIAHNNILVGHFACPLIALFLLQICAADKDLVSRLDSTQAIYQVSFILRAFLAGL
jgi:hypothetical protein